MRQGDDGKAWGIGWGEVKIAPTGRSSANKGNTEWTICRHVGWDTRTNAQPTSVDGYTRRKYRVARRVTEPTVWFVFNRVCSKRKLTGEMPKWARNRRLHTFP